MTFPNDAPVAELLLLIMSSTKNTNPNHDSMTQTPDCATSWKKKYILKQAHFFPLYTQKADHAAMKEIRDENLARFSFCKAIVLVQIQRD